MPISRRILEAGHAAFETRTLTKTYGEGDAAVKKAVVEAPSTES